MITMTLGELHIWIDHSERDAAAQMAVDEATFDLALEKGISILRFYRWQYPAVTIGYFNDFPESETRPVIRRITGGGLVEHGLDDTFCLTLPPGCPASQLTTDERYRRVHESLHQALKASDYHVKFVTDDGISRGPCFSNPVKWDLLDTDGRKLVGGAQRKSRGAVIHQGSVQLLVQPSFPPIWIERFITQLALKCPIISAQIRDSIEIAANPLISRKYGQANWNRNREFNAR